MVNTVERANWRVACCLLFLEEERGALLIDWSGYDSKILKIRARQLYIRFLKSAFQYKEMLGEMYIMNQLFYLCNI